MEKNIFERYGLLSNPFRDLASETLDNIDIFHSTQPIDEDLKVITDEVIEKNNKAIIVVLGSLGSGKTQRLMLVAKKAKMENAFCIFRTITAETKWTVSSIFESILEEAPLNFFEKYINQPRYLTKIKKLNRKVKKGYDPVQAGRLIAQALNSKSPSFLLINDLQNIPKTKDLSQFLQTLYIIMDNIKPGVMIMISSNKIFFDDIIMNNEATGQRINKKIIIPALKVNEATLLLAKRMLIKRVVDDLDIIYPFNKDAIKIMNDEVIGNPRHLIRLADSILEEAAKKKAITIDDEFVISHLKAKKGKEMLPPAPRELEQAELLKGIEVPDNIENIPVARTLDAEPEMKEGIPPKKEPTDKEIEYKEKDEVFYGPGVFDPKGKPPVATVLPSDQETDLHSKKKVKELEQTEVRVSEQDRKNEGRADIENYPNDEMEEKPEQDSYKESYTEDFISKDLFKSSRDKIETVSSSSEKFDEHNNANDDLLEGLVKKVKVPLETDLPPIPKAPMTSFSKPNGKMEMNPELVNGEKN
jgi:hypothetical protein